MSAINENTTNISFLSPLEFKFSIAKLPTTDFYIQSVNLPGIATGVINKATPFVKIPLIGDQINYENLAFIFKVDYQMKNYLELYNWFVGIGHPDDFQQAQTIGSSNRHGQAMKEIYNQGRYSDATLTILDGQRNPIVAVDFRSVVPVALGGLMLDSRKTSVDYVECTATFAYQSFEIKALNGS